MAKTKAPRDAAELLTLLNDEDFRREAAQILDRLWAHWNPSALPSLEEFNEFLRGFSQEHVVPFVRKWGALPPPFRELVAPDPRLPAFDMMISGRFGLIPVLPWTSQPQLLAAHRRIQHVIGRQHSDRHNTRRVQLTMWLSDHDLSIADIARVLWVGHAPPLRSQRRARRSVTLEEEQRLMALLMRQGLDYRTAEARLRRRLRRSETPRRAAIRMALTRYLLDRSVLNARIRDFQELDAVSLGIAHLFRATLETEDARKIRALAVAASHKFVEAAGTLAEDE